MTDAKAVPNEEQEAREWLKAQFDAGDLNAGYLFGPEFDLAGLDVDSAAKLLIRHASSALSAARKREQEWKRKHDWLVEETKRIGIEGRYAEEAEGEPFILENKRAEKAEADSARLRKLLRRTRRIIRQRAGFNNPAMLELDNDIKRELSPQPPASTQTEEK